MSERTEEYDIIFTFTALFYYFWSTKRNWVTEFSGYCTWNCDSDAACDEEYEAEDWCWCLVFLQPTMKLISPLFPSATLHSKYPFCSSMLNKWYLFPGHSWASGILSLIQASIDPLETWLIILVRERFWWWCLPSVDVFCWFFIVHTNTKNSMYC